VFTGFLPGAWGCRLLPWVAASGKKVPISLWCAVIVPLTGPRSDMLWFTDACISAGLVWWGLSRRCGTQGGSSLLLTLLLGLTPHIGVGGWSTFRLVMRLGLVPHRVVCSPFWFWTFPASGPRLLPSCMLELPCLRGRFM
jgi:hypothetical protein